MKVINNVTETVRADLEETLKKGSKLSIAAACFSINNIGKIVLADHMEHCIAEAVEHGDHKALDSFNKAIATFLK